MPQDDTMIELLGVSKSYSLEPRPLRRLWRQLTGDVAGGPQHHALRDVNLRIRRGEAVGVIGRNGAGKSTLLQLICGVLQPTTGRRTVRGRIAALLELGAGFNPELTGRENVRLNGPLLGMSPAQIEARLPEIVEFAGIGDFIDQPVRSYSSGMFVRLAFSMATSVDPDILVIDEALSVGDGVFARKSFERVMALKERGATILFCSHSLFQVESLCARALWIHDGRIEFDGLAHQAVVEYNQWLDRAGQGGTTAPDEGPKPERMETAAARIVSMEVVTPSGEGIIHSGQDDLEIRVHLHTDPVLPRPNLGVMLHLPDGRAFASAGNWLDGFELPRDERGEVRVAVRFPKLPVLKGRFTVSAFVLCDRAINLYASAEHVATLEVVQDDVLQGVVALPHEWRAA